MEIKVRQLFIRMENHIQNYKKFYYGLALFASFLVMALRIYETPFSEVDDLAYQTNYATGEPITFSTLIESANHMYLWHGGRYVVTIFLQIAMILGKVYIALSESLIIILIALLIAKIASFDNHPKPIHVLLVLGLFYYLNCTWSENVMWVTGFWTYTFSALLQLYFLYLFTLDVRGFKTFKVLDNPFGFLIIGLLAGCTTEAHALAMTLVCFFMLIYMYKKKQLKLKHIMGWIGLAIGTAVLVLAPGNFVRQAYVSTLLTGNIFYDYAVRVYIFLENLFEYDYLTIILLVGCYIFTNKDKFNNTTGYWFIAIGILAMLAMLGSSVNAVRTFNPTMCIFFIPILQAIDCSTLSKKKLSVITMVIYIGYIGINGLYWLFELMH